MLLKDWIVVHSTCHSKYMREEFWTHERREYHSSVINLEQNKKAQLERITEWWTPERRQEKSIERIEYFKNNPDAKKHLANLANTQRACEYCGKKCSTRNYRRWHGKECPQNPDVSHDAIEKRKKLGQSNKGKKHTQETINKRIETRKKRSMMPKPHTDETEL